jgi:hypothetical protein
LKKRKVAANCSGFSPLFIIRPIDNKGYNHII